MALLQHDEQGFITGGTPVTSIRRTTDLLSAIRSDVLAIKNAVVRGVNRTASQQSNASVIQFPVQRTRQTVVAVTPNRREAASIPNRARDAHGRYASTPVATPSRERVVSQASNASVDNTALSSQLRANTASLSAIPVADIVATNNQTFAQSSANNAARETLSQNPANDIATPRNRRVITPTRERSRNGRFVSNGDSTSNRQSENSMLGRFADRIATSITTLNAGGLENVDPTVIAAQEISQVATPLVRGFQSLTGSNKGDSRWLKKIFSILTITRRDSGLFQRTASRTLGHIDDNTEGGGGGGSDSGGGIMAFAAGFLLRYILPIFAGIALVGLAAWGLFTEGGKKFFKGVGAKISAGWDFVVQDLKLTFLDIGSRLSAGLDIAVDDIKTTFSAIGDKITGAWDGAIESFIKTFPSLSEWLKSAKDFMTKDVVTPVVETVKSGGNKANTFVKEKTGLDLKKIATTDIVTPSVKFVKNGLSSIGDLLQGGESGKEGYNAYNRGTGLGSNGHRDLTKMSLEEIQAAQALPRSDKGRLMAVGKYQMMPSTLKEGMAALKMSSDTKFDEATQEKLFSEYLLGKKRPKIRDYITGKSDDAQAAQIAGAQEWRSIADPRTGKTYADKGASGNKASISAKEWLASMDAARKLYQQNIRLGMTQKEAYSNAASGMQKIVDVSSKTQDVNSKLQTIETFQPVQSATAIKSVPSPTMFSLPKPQIISDMVPIQSPMNSDASRQSISVSVEKGDATQDLADRRIGLVATGGLSGH